MRKFFSSKTFVVVLVVVAICLSMAVYGGGTGKATPISSAVGFVTTPLQKAVSTFSDKVTNWYDYAFRYEKLQEENDTLHKQVSDMQQQMRDAQVALDENNRLRALLGIKERNRSFEFEICEVVGRDPGQWSNTLTLDKGSKAGIEVNDCVITEDGMVGYVSTVAPTYSEITTVIDTDMQAGALITRTRDIAIAEGEYSLMDAGNLKLSYLKTDADIVIGDTVETSGSGGIFPKGIMIGTVERIIPEQHGISNYAVIKPFVDVSAVKKVFVIKSFEVIE